MFYNPCIRHFLFRIVYHGISLIVFTIKDFRLKTDGTVFQFPETVMIVFIDLSGEDNLICNTLKVFTIGKEIRVTPALYIFEQSVNQFVIPTNRNPLVLVVEIVVVKSQAYGQTFDDECRKFRTFSSPLLFRITFDKFLINVFSY